MTIAIISFIILFVFSILFYCHVTTSDEELEKMGITPNSKRYESEENDRCPCCQQQLK